MMVALPRLPERRAVPTAPLVGHASTPAFDWLYALLTLSAAAGIWLDVWSHSNFGPDQTLFNEYHLLFYSAIALLGGFLAYIGGGEAAAGAHWSRALPAGYGLSAVGVLIFGVTGVLDLIGHALFGFEASIQALLSPTHQGLFGGFFLIALGPLRAAAGRSAPARMTLGAAIPLVIAATCALCALTYATLAYLPLGAGVPWPVQDGRIVPDLYAYTLGIVGIFLQTALLMGVLLWVLRELPIPTGSITLLFVLYGGLIVLFTRTLAYLPVWLIAGALGDAARAAIGPTAAAPWRFRLFGFVMPVILWGTYYGLLFASDLGGGVWYSGYAWVGSVVQAGAVGVMMATLLSLPRPVALAAPEDRL